MTKTENLQLNKPDRTDFYDIGIHNDNMDILDAELKKSNDHIANKSNPHEVTKGQVGLGNVPNVATNDQTPTYTSVTQISELSSGEKLSVAFGKLSKAVKDLISHLGNKSNPHSVTAEQAGAVQRRVFWWDYKESPTLLGYIKSLINQGYTSGVIQVDSYTNAPQDIPAKVRESSGVGAYFICKFQKHGYDYVDAELTADSSLTSYKNHAILSQSTWEVDWIESFSRYGFLSKNGGDVSGMIGVADGLGIVTSSSAGVLLEQREVAGDDSNRRGFWARSASTMTDLSYAFVAYNTLNGKTDTYSLHGTHNKPRSTYTGNGSATSRAVTVGGIGSALLVTSVSYALIVLPTGAIYQKSGESTVRALSYSEVHFLSGVLTIASSNEAVNGTNVVYNYQVL